MKQMVLLKETFDLVDYLKKKTVSLSRCVYVSLTTVSVHDDK